MFEDDVELAIISALRRETMTASGVIADYKVYQLLERRSSNPLLFGYSKVNGMLRRGLLRSIEGKLYVR